MKDLSLHILDIAENSIRAGAGLIEILLVEDVETDVLMLQINDNGKGMDPETARRAADPFFTGRPGRRFGLGLAMLAQATREAEGCFDIASAPDAGTRITATFRHSHPDRKPLGDIRETLAALVAGYPGVDVVYEHRDGQEVARFDTREVGRP